MTREEYAMLRSIAAFDGTEGPNFDPALLSELLDVYDAATSMWRAWDTGAAAIHATYWVAKAAADLGEALGR